KADRPAVEEVVAQARAPAWRELIHRLHIHAGLTARVRVRQRHAAHVVRERSVLAPIEILGLQLEVLARRIAVGRPLPDEIRNPELAPAGERVRDGIAGEVGRVVGAIVRRYLRVRDSGAPTAAFTPVAAGVREHRAAATAVLVTLGTGKVGTAPDFRAELEKERRRREPPNLQAVVVEL